MNKSQDNQNGVRRGCWLQRFVRWLVNFKHKLTPCRARLVYGTLQGGAGASKFATACGFGKSTNNIFHGWIILCSGACDGGERCPRLQTLRDTVARRNREKNKNLFFVSKLETHLIYCDGYVAVVDDLNAQSVLAPRKNTPAGTDMEADAVMVNCSPSIDDTKHRTEKPKHQTGDSSYERNMFHSAKPPNGKSSATATTNAAEAGQNQKDKNEK